MVEHGFRCDAKASRAGGFSCQVCGKLKNKGDTVVAFKNDNKSGRAGWDHVCADICADKYKPPALASSSTSSSMAAIGKALGRAASSAKSKLMGPSRAASVDAEFIKKAEALEFSRPAAMQVLEEHGGDKAAAIAAMSIVFSEHYAHDFDVEAEEAPPSAVGGVPNLIGLDEEDNEDDEDDEEVQETKSLPGFTSNDARSAGYDVFEEFIRPMLPKPQKDGSYKDGDLELLDTLMSSPIELLLPRPERLADLIKPETGWDGESLARARAYFALAAAGTQFLIFLPTITHRPELAESELFQVKLNGKVVGVRDCCPCCRTNKFVNVTDGTYTIRKNKDVSNNGVRFIFSEHGVRVPIARTCICRNPCCPKNVERMQQRGIKPMSNERPLPRGEAPDGKLWPSVSFATHSPAYINLIAEVLPELGAIYSEFYFFSSQGCDKGLAARLMETTSTVAALCREFELSFGRREKALMERYIAYMKKQQRQQRSSDPPPLAGALEASRPQRVTAKAIASAGEAITSIPIPNDATVIENSILRRFLELRRVQKSQRSREEREEEETVVTADVDADDDQQLRGPAAAPDPRPAAAEVCTVEAFPPQSGEPNQTTVAPQAAEDASGGGGGDLRALGWSFTSCSNSILMISESNIRTIMRNVHAALKPYLTADLLQREPGEFASQDHTFRIENRALGDAKAYSFFMGEDHSIFWHGAVKSTSYNDLEPAMQRMQKRFVRLGVDGKLKYMYDDICCGGKPRERLHEHPTVNIFPGVTRCPRKDGFHACQLVSQTFNAGTGEVDVATRDIGQQIRPIHEPDLAKAIDHLQAAEKLTRVEARREALKRYRGKGILRTFGPQPGDLEERWEKCIERFKQDRDAKGHASVVRQQHGKLIGTIEQMQSMMHCIRNGCYSDPLPIKKMYISCKKCPTAPTLVQRMKKSESVKNETVHQGVNRIVQDVKRMGEDMLDIRIDFYVLNHNRKIDVKLGRIESQRIGMPHEIDFLNEIARSVLACVPFPLAHARNIDESGSRRVMRIEESSEIFEPHGVNYYKSVDQERAQQAAAAKAAAKANADAATSSGASSSGAALPKAKAGGRRATAAHKGVTKALVNDSPLKPSTPAEIDLMHRCVRDARDAKKQQRGKRKRSDKDGGLWADAAELYGEAYRANCSVDEEMRQLIRGPTTGELIQQSYEALSANHRAFVASKAAAGEVAAQAVDAVLQHEGQAAMEAVDVRSDAVGAAAGSEVKVEKVSKGSARQRWKEKIEAGRVLTLETDIDGPADRRLGDKPLEAYLKAMGESVTREDREGAGGVRGKLKRVFSERGIDRWDPSKRQKSGV